MNKLKFLSAGLCFALNLYPQLHLEQNRIRIGDEIIKQQVEFKDPGRAGENVIWDFSQLKAINEEYTLRFDYPLIYEDSLYVMGKDTFFIKDCVEGELVTGVEHSTMYYYRIYEDKMQVLGHENPLNILHYTEPLISTYYPLNLGEIHQSKYVIDGLYSSREKYTSEGDVTISLDATGKMVLPSGDTLFHVARQKTYRNILTPIMVWEEAGDSLRSDTLFTEIENYKWYSKGYRYPVFETVRSFVTQDGQKQENFSTAFFYPPQEHYYLSYDPQNMAILDNLWLEQNNGGGFEPDKQGELILGNVFSYNFYPNPVETYLTVEYLLDESAEVSIFLFDASGRKSQSVEKSLKPSGFYTERIDTSALAGGNYILRLQVNEETITEKIIKK